MHTQDSWVAQKPPTPMSNKLKHDYIQTWEEAEGELTILNSGIKESLWEFLKPVKCKYPTVAQTLR